MDEISIVRLLRFGIRNPAYCLLVECPDKLSDQGRNLFSYGIGFLVSIHFPLQEQ